MADDLPARSPREPRAPRTGDTPLGGRELPHNIELEKAVLAALLDGRSAVAIQRVRPPARAHAQPLIAPTVSI